MAFVCEKLEGKDLEFVESFGFMSPLSSKRKANIPSKWIADHENDYYFICLGAGGGRSYETDEYPPSYYKLILKGKVVDIEARYKMEGNSTVGLQMWWRITDIDVPRGVMMQSDELKNMVKELFALDSNMWRKNLVKDVYFDEIVNPIYSAGGVQ